MSVLILLSLLAFSGSVSANVDGRKPVDRETIANKNRITKRNISLRQARHFLTSLEFFRRADQVSLLYSALQHAQAVQTALREHCYKKSLPPEIHQAVQLHAPRSADLITFLSRG